MHEVLRLRLNADLVTLSACETALGSGYFSEVPAGDEFVSLTRAFLSVGSESVMATLWQVDDRSSVQLMKQFYKRLHQSGAEIDKSAALANNSGCRVAPGKYVEPRLATRHPQAAQSEFLQDLPRVSAIGRRQVGLSDLAATSST